MSISKYVGHPSQLYGVEEHRLIGGKGDGLRLFEVRNASGLALTICADRCADIYRISIKGDNVGYFSPCGYVAPTYFDDRELGFLKSFTAGFLTTAGLTAVGSPSVDEGQAFGLHGDIGNTPAENIYYTIDKEFIHVHATINASGIFKEKLVLQREIRVSLFENKMKIIDTISNNGDTISPLMYLYHINFGYPLLDENSIIHVSSTQVVPRNARAAEDLDTWEKVLTPQKNFVEQCYYHSFGDDQKASAGIFSPTIGKGLTMHFDPHSLDCLLEWKMMGERDYVLGLEPGNCFADGRDAVRKQGKLKFIHPDQEISYSVDFSFTDSRKSFDSDCRG